MAEETSTLGSWLDKVTDVVSARGNEFLDKWIDKTLGPDQLYQASPSSNILGLDTVPAGTLTSDSVFNISKSALTTAGMIGGGVLLLLVTLKIAKVI